jgi:hypothetical protein
MSRSYRKNPILGNACPESEKKEKTLANRALRRINKVEVLKDSEIFSIKREISDVWCFLKDGKQKTFGYKNITYQWRMK